MAHAPPQLPPFQVGRSHAQAQALVTPYASQVPRPVSEEVRPTALLVWKFGDRVPEECFVSRPLDVLLCGVCMEPMMQASMCPEQHTFCEPCLRRAVDTSRRCPVCNTSMDKSKIQPARMARSMIDKLEVRCPCGCQECITIEDLEAHYKQCKARKVTCSNQGCQAIMPASEKESHTETCEWSTIACGECSASMLRKDEAAHSCIKELAAQLVHLTAALSTQTAKLEKLRSVVRQPASFVLGHPHLLNLVDQTDYTTRWHCDRCRRNGQSVRWRCFKCDFDLCGGCHTKNQKALEESQINAIVLKPALHPHALREHKNTVRAPHTARVVRIRCDGCSKTVEHYYACAACEFDVCEDCFSKSN
eukprot:m.164945 g.164945  ORF g.164945 m.164945 type:complete len:362 (+) comp14413_c0_seq5:175-1260(+)